MTEVKQVLLMRRLLHLHSIQNRKAGKACVARLTFDQFEQEVDKVCFLGYVMEGIARNQALFPADVVETVEFAIIEGCLSLIVFFKEETLETLITPCQISSEVLTSGQI